MRIRSLPWRILAGVLASLIASSSCFAVLNRKNSAKGDYGSGTEVFGSAPVTFTLSDGTKFTLESRVRCVTIAPGDCLHANSVFAYFYVLTIPAGGAAVTQRITLQLTAPFDPHNSSSMSFGILDQLDSNNFGTVIADCPAPSGPNTCVDAVLESTSSADANGTLTFNLNPQTLSSHTFRPGDQIFLYATSFTPPKCAFDLSLGLSCSSPGALTTALNLSSPSGAISPPSTQGVAPMLPTPGRRLLAPDESTYFFAQTSFTGNAINAQSTKGSTVTPLSGFLASSADHMGCQGCTFAGGQTILNVAYGYLYNLTIPVGTDVTALPATITVVVSAPFNQDNFEFSTFGILGTTDFSSVSSNVANCGSFNTTTGAAYDACLDAIVTNVVSQPQVVAGVPRPPTSLTFNIATSNLTAGDNIVLFATSNNKPNTCSSTTFICLSTTPVALSGDASASLSIATGSPNTVVGPSDAVPVPTITSLSPNSAAQSSGAFTLTVNGSNFVVGAQVLWNGSPRQTTYASSTQVTAAIPASDLLTGGLVPVTVSNPPNPSVGPNPEISGAVNFTVITPNPVPSITSFSPASALAGGSAFTLTVNGSGFVPSSVVSLSGSAKTTTFVTSSSLTIPITASDIATAGSFPVTVFNPAPGGGTSTPLNFTVNNPAPTVTSLAPATVIAGGVAFSLTVNGTGFVSGSQVKFNGSPRTTTFTSSTALSAAITAADIATAGSATITVTNSAPGGGTSTVSAASTLTINNPLPTIASLSPTSATAGGALFTLTVNGTSFVNGAAVTFNGKAETTTFVSANQLTATIPAADIATAGNVNVVVNNPAPNAGPSSPTAFVINNPAPTVASLSPSSVTAGAAAFTLIVNGTNFVTSSKVNFNGSARTTAFVSSTQVTASITAADVATASTANITVTNPTPGGGTSAAATLPINNPSPSVTLLSPSTAIAGSAGFTLMLTGTNFVSNSLVNFNGKAETTLFTSATQLSATIPAADIATGATVNVTVTNPSPGGGTSTAQSFTINNPAPTVTSIAPTTAIAGGAAFSLTVTGTGFVPSSQVNFNGSPRATTFTSATVLGAAITAADIAIAGSATITVTNPTPGGGTSASSPASTLAINNPLPTISSLSPSSTLAGTATFTLTVNGTNFVAASKVNFAGTAETTTFVSSTKLTASIPASAVATAGSPNVTVTNPAPGGGTSTAAVFTVLPTNPSPTLTSVAPTAGILGQPASLTLTGSNLISASVVNFGSNADSGGIVTNGGNTLTITIPGAQLAAAGSINISVTNPAPGGGISGTVPFTVQNPVPANLTLSPTNATAGGALFTLTVNGASFVSGAAVSFNGKPETTSFVNSTQLTATIPAADIAVPGNVNVVVTNPAPTAGPSAPAAFVINNPAPTVTSLAPSSVTAGAAAFTLAVNGTNFVSGSKVNFNGSARTTTFVSSTQVTASITAADVATASTANITVTNPTPGGGTSAAATLPIDNPSPSVTVLSPSTVLAGSAGFTLMLTGTNFVSNSLVNFNGKAETTVFTSTTQLSATIPAADIATGATVNVTVTNPSPGGGTSTAQSFGVNNPVPVLSSLGQTHAPGGTAFTLTVNGQKFVTGSVINLGAKPEPTTFVSTSQLTATIPAADVATAGMLNITVNTPMPGGGASSALTLTIDGFSESGPSGSTTVAAGQPAMFTITVAAADANGFPNAVSFSASGVPSLASASFSPMTVTPGATNATTMLTITTTAPSLLPPAPTARPYPLFPWLLAEVSLATLFLALLAALREKAWMPARSYSLAWPAVLLMLLVAGASGCAGGGGGSVSRPGTLAGTYPITVTATSGSLSQSTNVTLVVSAH